MIRSLFMSQRVGVNPGPAAIPNLPMEFLVEPRFGNGEGKHAILVPVPSGIGSFNVVLNKVGKVLAVLRRNDHSDGSVADVFGDSPEARCGIVVQPLNFDLIELRDAVNQQGNIANHKDT